MCDCAVALGEATGRRATLFGKNSDREKPEAQPARSFPAAEHAPGKRLRCTYIELAQVPHTAALLGSGPFWCWGLEQGVNEHGVAIGNESVFTHEEFELSEPGLLGMDLVRLALERSASAREAVELIGGLIEQHGQGGQGWLELPFGYSNGFLIADASEAWTLQSSSQRWAARRIHVLGSISNHPGIGSDWERISPDAESYAIERGWWSPERGRFDFEAAYRSTRIISRAFSELRQQRSTALLEERRGSLGERDFFRILRDHGGSVAPPADDPEDDARWTLCAHNGLQQDTAASLVAALDRPVCWLALAAPCSSVYLPLWLGAPLPRALVRAEKEASDDSAWWRFKRLQQLVEADFAGRLPRVRERFDRLEDEWLAWGAKPDDPAGRMEEACSRALEACDQLIRRLSG